MLLSNRMSFHPACQVDPPRGSNNDQTAAIVLLHGLGLNRQTWGPLTELLTEQYQVVRYDLRGHGESGLHDEAELSWELLCCDLDKVLEACGLSEVHLIGHGLGGNLAAHYAQRASERVKSIVLLSTVGFYPPDAFQRSFELRQQYANQPNMEMLAQQMGGFVTTLPADSEGACIIRNAYLQVNRLLYFQLMDLFASTQPLEELARIEKPCLVLAGDRDSLYPSFMSGITAQFIPDSIFATVPDAANMMFLDNPSYTAAKILAFLSDPAALVRKDTQSNPLIGWMRQNTVESLGQVWRKQEEAEKAAQLKVTLIGTFRVEVNGVEKLEGWQQRSAKRLLVYLLLHPVAVREQICEALWPLTDPRKAQNMLRVSLSHLRGLFKAVGCSPIRSDRSQVYLQAAVSCDMLERKKLLKEAYAEQGNERKEFLIRELMNTPVDAMFHGLYDEWVLQEQRQFEYLLHELIRWLILRLLEQGEQLEANMLTRRLQTHYSEESEVKPLD